MKKCLRAFKLKFGPSLIRQLVARGCKGKTPILGDRIVVAGLFNTASGIGESARLCFEGLQSQGVTAEALNLSWVFDQTDFEYEEKHVDQMESLESGGTLILHLNGPEALSALWKIGLRRWHRNWKIIGYWAWELPSPPPEWERAIRFLSEIWVPSTFVKKAILPLTKKPIRVVPHAIRFLNISPRTDKSELKCLVLADALSSFARKNLTGAINAYLAAFPNPKSTQLVVKCRNINSHPSILAKIIPLISSRPDIEIISDTLTLTQIQNLIATSDVLISLHRAEGFGLTIAEAMSAGNIVMSTGWSGNMEFTSEDTAILISYDLVPVDDPFGIYRATKHTVWADPNIEEATNKLRDISNNVDLYNSMRTQAAQHIRKMLDPANYVAALFTDDRAGEAD